MFFYTRLWLAATCLEAAVKLIEEEHCGSGLWVIFDGLMEHDGVVMNAGERQVRGMKW